MSADIVNETSEVNLEQLVAEIRRECAAAREAGRSRVDHAIAAGKHLLKVRERIGRGLRRWLEQHGFSKTDCYDFMLLAQHEQSVRSSGQSSIAAALRMLRAKSVGPKRPGNKTNKRDGSPLSKAPWTKATINQRQRYLDDIGVDSFCEACSFAFRAELKRRVGKQQAAMGSALAGTVAAAIRHALSIQKTATDKDAPAIGVANALNGINNKLASAGLDLNDIEVVIRATTKCAA
jgi:hypothetical protein